MRPRIDVASLGLVLLAAGCFSPRLPEGFSCARTGDCPEGQHCGVDGRCSYAGGDEADAACDGPGGAALCSDPSLALCLRFEGDVADGSTSGALVAVGGNPTFVEGVDGQALYTAAGYLTASGFIRGQPGPISVDLWVRADADAPTTQPLLAWKDELHLELAGDDLRLRAGGVTFEVGPLESEVWHHVALVSSADRLALYLDGGEVASGSSLSLAPNPEASLGSDFGTGQLQARIDTARVWSRALSSAEIADIVAAVH